MINLYLLRHGKTEGKPALNGHTDVGVDEITQQLIARSLLENYRFQTIYSSPLIRCKYVAELLTALDPALNLKIDDRLREQSFGRFDGVPFDDLQGEWETLERFWADPANATLPDAEPLSQGMARVTEAWEELVQQCEHDTLIIAHGGPIRYILAHVLGLDWQNPRWYTSLAIPNQSLTHITLNWYQSQPYLTVNAIACPLL
ncbi:histidine phosphatase family protein [Vibrio mangrovi]|nr:Putative phosphoserine phosphatase 2 [Vibrio mangrovi]